MYWFAPKINIPTAKEQRGGYDHSMALLVRGFDLPPKVTGDVTVVQILGDKFQLYIKHLSFEENQESQGFIPILQISTGC